MTQVKWQDLYPELNSLIMGINYSDLTIHGAAYLAALDRAYQTYGLEGLGMQLPYLVCNLKKKNAGLERDLMRWSALLKQEAKNGQSSESSS